MQSEDYKNHRMMDEPVNVGKEAGGVEAVPFHQVNGQKTSQVGLYFVKQFLKLQTHKLTDKLDRSHLIADPQ